MFEFSSLLGVLIASVAGVVLSALQEKFKGADWIARLNQRYVAIALALLAGLATYAVETWIGFDLFSDVAGASDILALIGVAFGWGQLAYDRGIKPRKKANLH